MSTYYKEGVGDTREKNIDEYKKRTNPYYFGHEKWMKQEFKSQKSYVANQIYLNKPLISNFINFIKKKIVLPKDPG